MGRMGRVTAWLSRTAAGYAAVFRSENLRRSQLAWAGAVTAEWAFFVGLGVFAFQEGGTVGVGLVSLIRMLPSALVAPFASLLGDRYRRDRVVLGLFVAMAAAVAIAALALLAEPPVALIYALAAVHASASTLSRSAQWALLPSLCRTPEELVAANSSTMTTENLGTLAGPLVGGILLAATDAGSVFAACVGVYLVAAVLLSRLRIDEAPGPASRAESLVAELLGGFRALVHQPPAALIIGLFCGQALLRGALNVFVVVVALRLLDIGESGVGFLTAAVGAGGLAGAFLSLSLTGKRLAAPFAAGLIFWGLPFVGIGAWPAVGVAVAMVAVVGGANSVLDVAGLTLLQRLVPNDVLTRVLGVLWGLAMAMVGVGSIITAGLIASLGIRPALVITGAFLPIVTVLAWRWLAATDRSAEVPAEQLGALASVPMLAHLSLVAKEEIAARLVPLTRPAGTEVIREGEGGDRFYIVVEGEADVTRGGKPIAVRTAPDYFGEIALLRDVPRTATVTARTAMRLYALERDDFIGAVTGHATGRAAGEAVVSERLATA
jgi:MFS family permease